MDNPLELQYWITSQTGLIHAFAALIGLILGPVIFLLMKGNVPHRLLGGVWILLMLTTDVSALMTYELGGRPNLFHFFALVNLGALVPAFYYVQKYKTSRNEKDLRNHMEYMAWAYFGLAAAGAWQIIISLARIEALPFTYPVLFNTLGGFTALSAVMLFIILKRKKLSHIDGEYNS